MGGWREGFAREEEGFLGRNYFNSLADQLGRGSRRPPGFHQLPVSDDLCARASLWPAMARGTGKQ